MEKIQYRDFQNCLRLTNGEVEIIVTTDFGPRIIAYNFVGGENVLGLHPHAQLETALGVWKPYGGHRLWAAPEHMPNSYAPDNEPVEYFVAPENLSVRLVQPLETVTATQKEIIVTLDETGSGVRVSHKIQNLGASEIELSAWALTIMRGGGEVLIPNEPFAPYSGETLLPVRNLTVWSYTDLSDARWSFDREFIRLKVDEHQENPQKIGVLNKSGWIKYRLQDVVFTKTFEHQANALYPDMNSNTEVYTAGSFIEVETLSPLRQLAAGDAAEHREFWELAKPV
ncbi:MAG TPA: hypothetical protein VGC97_18795 [Pyrinomonadaceae bacterium]|jgi:hypothetical protein